MNYSTILAAELAIVVLATLHACNGDGKNVGDAQGDPDVVDTVDDALVDDAQPPPPPPKVDILAVIDNSSSMADEQAALQSAIPVLISSILDPPIDPVSGERIHEPIRDVHVGVISTDMGVAGYYNIQSCEDNRDVGDDGILQHTSSATGCAQDYPSYLAYEIGESDEPDASSISTLSHDFGCITVLGTDGCSIEQPLEAALKALTVHSLPGGENEGFLREDSLLAVIFVTDENDCSVSDTTFFDPSVGHSLSLKCTELSYMLHPIERYVEGFSNLRADLEHLVMGMIVGVPTGSICNGWGDSIGGCLALDDMQEIINSETGDRLELVCKYLPECTPPDPPFLTGDCLTAANPARRFVEVAQGLGSSAFVQSICTDSYVPFMNAVVERIGEVVRSSP